MSTQKGAYQPPRSTSSCIVAVAQWEDASKGKAHNVIETKMIESQPS